jgi:hypothetical protein
MIMQIVTFNPLAFPLWALGLWAFFADRDLRRYRIVSIVYVVVTLIFILTNAKLYISAAIYPLLVAGGCTFIEKRLLSTKLRWIGPAYLSLVVTLGILIAPNGLPVFQPEGMSRYFSATSFLTKRIRTDNLGTLELPRIFADRFSWEEAVKAIADAYDALPAEERSECMFFTGDYGHA